MDMRRRFGWCQNVCGCHLIQLHCHTRGSPSTSRSFHLTISPTPLSFFYSHFHTFSTSLLVQACLLYFLDGITHLRRPTTMCLWVRASGCMCLRTSMCCTPLSSIGHIPVRATTSPVAMVVKQAEKEGEEWRETDRQGRGGKLDDECMFWSIPRRGEGRGGGKDWL